MREGGDPRAGVDESYLGSGMADLMLSFGILMLLLWLATIMPPVTPERHTTDPPPAPIDDRIEHTKAVLADRLGLPVYSSVDDPLSLVTVVPNELMNFALGKPQLPREAHAFVQSAMPVYADVLCAAGGEAAEAFVIEGHTDDLGSDVLNLRLSQQRSLNVLLAALDAVKAERPDLSACFRRLASASGRGSQFSSGRW